MNFAAWWALWASVKGTNRRLQARDVWHEVVPPDELACMECTASYLASLSSPAGGFYPDSFLYEQSADRFAARWPEYRVRSKPGLVERTNALVAARIARGERPL